MTATEELRRLLDERGVEWRERVWGGKHSVTTFWHARGVRWHYRENRFGELRLHADGLAPEQAIAATLGSCNCSNNCTNSERTETCHNASKVMDEHGQARFACSECHAWIDSRLLWNPEYRNGESPWVNNCKLNFCPNCGRRIVDPTTNDADAEVTDG